MTVRRSKKVRKQRGSRTHSYGRVSGGHRKGGSRGGVGKAGSKGHHRIGRISDMIHSQRGFTIPEESTTKVINVGEIEEQLETLLETNKAKKEGSIIKLDVRELGISKVLGKGLVHNSIHLYTNKITSKAQEKIEAAGGKVFQDSQTE